MKWTHRMTIVTAYAVIALLAWTRCDFAYWYLLPLLGGGGSILTVNIIWGRRQRHNQPESPRIAAKREEIKIREMEDDYADKPVRDSMKLLLKVTAGLIVVAVVCVLALVILKGPESAPGVTAWIELLWCQRG